MPAWLLPNALNLDAPLVAIAWQHAAGAATGSTISMLDQALLFLAVWQVYTVDHLLDAATGRLHGLADRHRFHARFRRTFLVVSTAVAPVVVFLAARLLNPVGWSIATALALATALHFYMVRSGRMHRLDRLLPKEVFVGAVFAAGVCLISISRAESISNSAWLLPPVLGFLCISNCLFVTLWERLPDDSTRASPWLDDSAGRRLAWISFAMAAALLLLGTRSYPSFLWTVCAGSSFALLGLLHFTAGKRHTRMSRVLADAVLLTPLSIPLLQLLRDP
jgi:hypothetical protein